MSAHLADEQLLDLALHIDGAGDDTDDHADAPVGDAQKAAAAHVTACPACRDRLRSLRDDLGLTLAPLAPVGDAQVPATLRAHILSATQPDGADALAGFHPRICRLFGLSDDAGHAVLRDAMSEQAWQISGPMSLFHFHPGPSLRSQAEAGVIRLFPGVSFPPHRHIGDEYGLVLTGALREDATGRIGYPGDVLFMPQDSKHTVTAVSQTPCIFLVLLYGGTPEIEWC